MDRLSELSAFLAVADHGGFSSAARTLRTSTPTVSRLIGALERRLQIKLFDRTSRRCMLTDQGNRFAVQARSILEEYDRAISLASDEATQPAGRIRLTAPFAFGREHVAPLILRLLDEFPGLSVELALSDVAIDLHAEGVDLAVRIGPINDDTLRATRIGWVKAVTVASPDYLEKFGTPESPANLQRHLKIQHGSHADAPWRFKSGKKRSTLIPINARFTVNQADAALAAARAGHGLVTALTYQVHDDLRTGKLVRVLRDYEADPLPVWLTWPDGRDRLLRVRIAIDFLAGALRKIPVLLGD